MRPTLGIAAIAAVSIGLVIGSTAQAASKQERKQARGLYNKGQRLYNKGKYLPAIERLEKALRFWNRPEFHFAIALCHLELKNKVKVVIHVRAYLKATGARGRRSLPDAIRQVLEGMSILIVKVPNPKASIWIDGKNRGRGDQEIVLEPGKRQVAIKLGGATVVSKALDLEAGATRTWEVVIAAPRRRADPPSPPAPKPRSSKTLHWAGVVTCAAIAVVAGAAAIGTGVKAKQVNDDFSDDPTFPTRRRGLRWQNATNALWGVAGAFAVTAAVLAAFTRWGKKKEKRASLLTVTPTGVAVAW